MAFSPTHFMAMKKFPTYIAMNCFQHYDHYGWMVWTLTVGNGLRVQNTAIFVAQLNFAPCSGRYLCKYSEVICLKVGYIPKLFVTPYHDGLYLYRCSRLLKCPYQTFNHNYRNVEKQQGYAYSVVYQYNNSKGIPFTGHEAPWRMWIQESTYSQPQHKEEIGWLALSSAAFIIGKTKVFTLKKAEWAPGTVCTRRREEKSPLPPLPGIEPWSSSL